jgi:peptidyl-prolyl cis-trans isomerase C
MTAHLGSRTAFLLAASLLVGAPWPASAQEAKAAAGERVIARVNGEALHAEDVESVLGEVHRTSAPGERPSFDLDRLLFRLINDTLLAQEARALGMHESPEHLRRLNARRDELVRARLYREEVLDRLELDEEAVRAVHDDIFRTATLRLLTRRDRVELERLLPRARAAATAEAFGELAKAESQDTYQARGGLIEGAPLGDLFFAVRDFAAAARPGELSEPLETPWGTTLARLEKLDAADPETYPQRRRLAFFELRRRQETELRGALAQRIRQLVEVTLDAEAIAAVECQRMHDGRLLPKFDDAERVVARIGDRTVTTATLAAQLATSWSGLANVEMAMTFLPPVLDDLVFDQLLVAEALRRGYGSAPEVERELHALATRQLATRFLKEVLATEVEIDSDELRAYYDAHREEFRRPPNLHLLQLTVGSESEALRLVEQARGGADFSWLARRHSTDRFRDSGGDRGWIPANRGLLLFVDELAGAAAGDVFGPKGFENEWVIVKVDVVSDQGAYAFEEVSGNVRGRIVDERLGQRVERALTRLRERSEIWIDEAAVAEMRIAPAPHEGRPAVPGHTGN